MNSPWLLDQNHKFPENAKAREEEVSLAFQNKEDLEELRAISSPKTTVIFTVDKNVPKGYARTNGKTADSFVEVPLDSLREILQP